MATQEKAQKVEKVEKGKTRKVRVVATRLGFYGLKRRRAGQMFDMVLQEGETLPTWVVTPEEYKKQQAAEEEERIAGDSERPGLDVI